MGLGSPMFEVLQLGIPDCASFAGCQIEADGVDYDAQNSLKRPT
jgi:hypothetical protein